MFDVTLSGLVQMMLILGSVLTTVVTLRVTVKYIKEEFRELKQSTKEEISGIHQELTKIGEILVNQADIRGEIAVLKTRVDSHDQQIKDVQTRCEREHFRPRSP